MFLFARNMISFIYLLFFRSEQEKLFSKHFQTLQHVEAKLEY